MNQYSWSENKERCRSLPDKMIPETSTKSRENKNFHLTKLLGLLTTDVQELVTSVRKELDNDKDFEEQQCHITNLKKENEALQIQIEELKQKVPNVLHNEEANKKYFQNKISELEKQLDSEKQARLKVEKTHQDKVSMLQHKIDQHKDEIENLEKEKRNSKDDLVKRDEQRANKALSERCDNLEKKLLKTKEELKKTQDELEHTKTRLSKSMGDRLTDKNPNIADLSDRNRPTKLGERFQEIYDNEWTDAFEIIGSGRDGDEKVVSVLVSILMDTKDFCDKEAENHMKKIQSALMEEPNAGSTALPVNINKQLKEIRKCVAEYTGDHIYKRYRKDLRGSIRSTAQKAESVPKYLEACFKVCWLMSIQDPPVVFGPDIQRGDEFNTDLYKAYTKSGKKVAYVVWPALLLHKEGPVLCKGVAQGLEDTTRRSKSAPPNERVDMGNEFRNEERNIKGHVNDLHVLDLEQSDGYLSKDKKYKQDRKYGIGTHGYDSGLNGYETYSKDIYKSSTGTYEARHGGTEQGCLGGYKSIDLRNDIGHTYEKPTRGYETKPLEHGLYTRDYHRGYDSGTPSYESNYRSGAAYRRQDYLRYESDYSDHGHRTGAYHQTVVSQPSRPSQKIAPRRDLRPAWKL